jgi:hypothetical protein
MAHSHHEPGTREDCEECRALAYEPGWYKALRDERVVGKDLSVVSVPEPDEDVEVVVAETTSEPTRRRR